MSPTARLLKSNIFPQTASQAYGVILAEALNAAAVPIKNLVQVSTLIAGDFAIHRGKAKFTTDVSQSTSKPTGLPPCQSAVALCVTNALSLPVYSPINTRHINGTVTYKVNLTRLRVSGGCGRHNNRECGSCG
jgi:hypothetical protein